MRSVSPRRLGGRSDQSRRKRRLLIDVSVIIRHDAKTGIQRVVRALGEHLHSAQQVDFDVRFVGASRFVPFRFVDGAFLTGKPVGAFASFVIPRRGDVFLGLDLSSRILPRYIWQVARWRRRGVKMAVLIYDLLPIQHPEWFEGKLKRSFENWVRFVADQCDVAFCISRSVGASFTQWLARTPDVSPTRLRLATIPLGGDLLRDRQQVQIGGDDLAKLERLSSRPFLLVVGTIEPRKGHTVLLDAFDRLSSQDPRLAPSLVIVGRPGWKTTDLQARMRAHPMLGRSLFWFDDASDALVDRLYRQAAGVVVPSYAEGFGLPLAEAAILGKRILARDIAVFREHDFPNVTYFSEDDPASLAASITSFLASDAPIAPARAVSTWRQSGEKLIEALAEL